MQFNMMNGVRTEVTDIFDDIFQYQEELSQETSQEDVPKWDSLQHVALVTAIEEQFAISLTMDEMMEMRSVRDIHAVLERHGV